MIDRYTLPDMKRLWSDEARFQRWLDVEIAACEVLTEEGRIPRDALAIIKNKASFDVAEIDEIERETQHDVIAFITCVARRIGPEGRFVHQGLTSSDVVDTAFSMAIRDAIDLVMAKLAHCYEAVRKRSREHAHTMMVGRTHGVHAEPTTFGLKLAIWYQELRRHEKRLQAAREEVSVGKISGAVGNYSSLAPALEERMLAKLDLGAAPVSSQILQRDRHAAVMSALGGLASSIEKFATEIRALAKTEVREVEEPFGKGQKGSSAMPHKRNPVVCERLCGMARLVRGHVVVALENVALWHERDISHSSAERVIFPDAFTLLHYMLTKFTAIVRDMPVFVNRMKENLLGKTGVVFSGKVLLALTEAGLAREDAYALVQEHCVAVLDEGKTGLLDRLRGDERVVGRLGVQRLEQCFDLEAFRRHADEILERALT